MRTTNVHDHAKSDQHAHVIDLHRRELAFSKGLGATYYSLIAQALSTLPEDDKKLRPKFDANERLLLVTKTKRKVFYLMIGING